MTDKTLQQQVAETYIKVQEAIRQGMPEPIITTVSVEQIKQQVASDKLLEY